MNNCSFSKLCKDNKLKELYSFWNEFDKKILVFDSLDTSEKFNIKKTIFIYTEQILISAYYIFGEKFKIDDVLALYTSMPETFTSNMDKDKYDFSVKSIYYLKSFSKNYSYSKWDSSIILHSCHQICFLLCFGAFKIIF